jgi:hypothetical protein
MRRASRTSALSFSSIMPSTTRDPQDGMNWPLWLSFTAHTMHEAPASKPSR